METYLLANYHTHTPRCHHASGSEEEYIQAALRCGYRILGFSDHAPWPYRSGYISNCRMLPAQLEDYVNTLHALRDKYAQQLHLHIGLEAEYFPAYLPWLKEQVEKYRLEYLIFGNHFRETEETGDYFGACTTPAQLQKYTEYAIAGMESGLYTLFAHPDLCLNHYPKFDAAAEHCMRQICEAAERTGMPLEYNLLGETRRILEHRTADLGYTTAAFWELAADYPVKAVVSCDAHLVESLDAVKHIHEVKARLRARGIEVLDTLPGLE